VGTNASVSGGKVMKFANRGWTAPFLFKTALFALLSACSGVTPDQGETTGSTSLASTVTAGTWSTVIAPTPFGLSTFQLLTDGSVLAGDGGVHWARLVPDSHGSYEHGQWLSAATSHVSRLYNPSTILKDGRYWIGGGEWPAGGDHATAEIYDPVADQWQQVPDMPDPIGDTAASILADGRLLCSSYSVSASYFFDSTVSAPQNPWTLAVDIPGGDGDERGWALLQDGTVLDPAPNGSLYDPASNSWSATGPLTEAVFAGGEVGPLSLLHSGHAIQFGAAVAPDVGHTQIYDPATRTWTSGPDAPDGLHFSDSPACVMPNGRVLVTTGSTLSGYTPQAFWEYDPTAPGGGAFASVPLPPTTGFIPFFSSLPNGQVLVGYQGATTAYLYTPSGAPQDAWRPSFTLSAQSKVGALTLSGNQLNGLTQGASFGDDLNMASSFPVVWLTDSAGNVTFARTYGFSQMAPSPAAGTAKLALPSGLPLGTYTVHASASGVEASNTTTLTIGSPWVTSLGGPTITDSFGRVQWSLTLSQAAPAGGTMVDLSADTPAVAVPFTVTVPAGATSTTFTVQYGLNGAANIYAAARSNVSRVVSAPFGTKVTAFSGPRLPATGNVVNWQVTISPPPPASGLALTVSSSDPSVATVPDTVVVTSPDGTATVPVTITGSGAATLNASMIGSNQFGTVGFNVVGLMGPRAPLSGNVVNWSLALDTSVGSAGAVVNLSSSDTRVATVPATVSVVNAAAAQFLVTLVAPGTAQIYASVTGSTMNGPIGLDVDSMTATPTTIAGVGNTAVGTLTLNGFAPTGGAVFNLGGLGRAVSVPAQVTVPAHARSAQFTITAVSAPGSTLLSANLSSGLGLPKSLKITTTP
jgi:hypothetical protein